MRSLGTAPKCRPNTHLVNARTFYFPEVAFYNLPHFLVPTEHGLAKFQIRILDSRSLSVQLLGSPGACSVSVPNMLAPAFKEKGGSKIDDKNIGDIESN